MSVNSPGRAPSPKRLAAMMAESVNARAPNPADTGDNAGRGVRLTRASRATPALKSAGKNYAIDAERNRPDLAVRPVQPKRNVRYAPIRRYSSADPSAASPAM